MTIATSSKSDDNRPALAMSARTPVSLACAAAGLLACAAAPAQAPRADHSVTEDSPAYALVYGSDRSGAGDLYVDCLDGSEARLLVGSPAAEWGPRWVEGLGLLFVRDDDEGGAAILRWTLEGETLVLEHNPAVDEAPVWDPTGEHLFFPAPGPAGDGLTVMRAQVVDGQLAEVQPLGAQPGVGPWVSPDGRQVAFVHAGEVYVVPGAGGEARNLTQTPDSSEGHPRWHPLEPRVMLWSDRSGQVELWSVPLDGGAWTQLSDTPGNDLLGAWSPDGAQLAIGSTRADEDWEVFIAEPDGSAARRLSERPGFDGDPQFVPAEAVGCAEP